MGIGVVQSRVSLAVIAAAFLLQLSPGLAAGQPTAQQATIQGSRPVQITFTKWATTGTFLAGIAGGDVPGRFVGEVLEGQTSVNPELNPNPEGLPGPLVNGVRRLEALYQVNADDEQLSFTALIRGGQNQVTGVARFTGFVAAGWRSGARVSVEYQRYWAGDPHCLDAGAPVTATCFQGVIRVDRAPTE